MRVRVYIPTDTGACLPWWPCHLATYLPLLLPVVLGAHRPAAWRDLALAGSVILALIMAPSLRRPLVQLRAQAHPRSMAAVTATTALDGAMRPWALSLFI